MTSFIRTGGEWVNGSRDGHGTRESCKCADPTRWPECDKPPYGYYRGGTREEGRFTSTMVAMPTDPIRRLLATDGKAYKLFKRAIAKGAPELPA